MLLHYVKAWIGLLTMPLVVVFLVAALAAACQFRGKARAARWLFLAAAVLTYLASTTLVGDALLGPLERRYASLSEEQPPPQVGYVVVLGYDYRPHDGVSVATALDGDGLVRIVEGIRLMRWLGNARLVVSGGAEPGRAAPALGYANFARQFGVPAASIVPLGSSLDTASEARAVTNLLGRGPFILVTSAYHMPRALWLMRRAGANPTPAPVGQHAAGVSGDRFGELIPGSSGLYETEHAVHEYMGLLAMTMGFN
jgi:uncharacterized SAM-binding protein YcdF (DUF218 family)